VTIGGEPGKIIGPTAFAVARDGSFAVADTPNGLERIQVFTAVGSRLNGFLLPGRAKPRVVLGNLVLNGIGSLTYDGASIFLSQPESGGLVTEYTRDGDVVRTFGTLRPTGHDDDVDVRVALNSGFPLVDPTGGFYFVFQSGVPVFRKYDADGSLVFERLVQGREVDELVAALPTTWPRHQTEAGELPLVTPTIRAAAVDRDGRLWMSLATPYTYVYDRDGDKIRTVQLAGAGVISPNSLAFGKNGRLLVTPGLYVFAP
jgi:hypothetical protein